MHEVAPDDNQESIVPPSIAGGFGEAEIDTVGVVYCVTVTDLAVLPAPLVHVTVNVRS